MNIPSFLHLLAASAFASALVAPVGAADFTPLFDGKTLDGWEQHSGTAQYRVEDGAIVGKTVIGTGNSFLCTKKRYADFIFEFEFKVSPEMNSGVQFRSEFFPEEKALMVAGKEKKIPADRVHGYQFEIDPSKRAFTGGIYDEARRGWLADLKSNDAARAAFKQGEWNAGRIECRGESLKTWINDVPAAEHQDGLNREGVIALQVHGIGKAEKKAGEEIRWRNLRIKELK